MLVTMLCHKLQGHVISFLTQDFISTGSRDPLFVLMFLSTFIRSDAAAIMIKTKEKQITESYTCEQTKAIQNSK